MKYRFLFVVGVILITGCCAEDDFSGEATPVENLASARVGSKTDDEVVIREEEAIKLDGLNVAQIKELRAKSQKYAFEAEVSRMMKLIINSLYRNKEIFLRELISNASDALDKIRLLSLTDSSVLEHTPELAIRIKADKENKLLHITDTGIGMTKNDLISNLGTIAKSGTAEFLSKMQDSTKQAGHDLNDMIGQFGVGFYSAFLVADKVIVSTKHNEDEQHIWESDATNFSVVQDPRGNTQKRGSTITLYMKEEASEYLDVQTLKNLIKKYSQFINFPIYLWSSKTITEEQPIDDEEAEPKTEEDEEEKKDEDIEVEDAKEKEDKPKTKKVEKTVWDWELANDSKPIWTRKPVDVEDKEYSEFYKSLTKDTQDPLSKVHFVAEGEVTFKSLLFVPKVQPSDSFNKYGTQTDNIKLYVRRVFITDEFADMLPKYLAFIRGVVDSDDLPLNVSRETLQQHKLLKVIKKKLVRKALDMIKKLEGEDMDTFWKEYSTNIKLGIVEDPSNRSRLSKLLRFHSSNKEGMTTLSDYVSRMKPKQTHIYYIAGASRQEVETSPFVERLLKKKYEVLYLVEAIDEYSLSALPEFEGKKFQNVAKEGFTLPEEGKKVEALKSKFETLTNWLMDKGLKDKIAKAMVSERLTDSPCALVASMFGWTGNMERLAISNAHQKADDPQRSFYLGQKKTLEINPRHPLIKELQRRVSDDPNDSVANDIALMMFRTATLRSGYLLQDTAEFAQTVESMMKQTLGISEYEQVEDEEEEEDISDSESDEKPQEVGADDDEEDKEDHDEL
ncbi:heat shock protein 90 Gp93 [Lycorma delicatula]|uniref:heat shock protein 90 Gp93 n=1 Tax=Lycorma delicatula TaxID=130591 RepID=UPI003F5112C6